MTRRSTTYWLMVVVAIMAADFLLSRGLARGPYFHGPAAIVPYIFCVDVALFLVILEVGRVIRPRSGVRASYISLILLVMLFTPCLAWPLAIFLSELMGISP